MRPYVQIIRFRDGDLDYLVMEKKKPYEPTGKVPFHVQMRKKFRKSHRDRY